MVFWTFFVNKNALQSGFDYTGNANTAGGQRVWGDLVMMLVTDLSGYGMVEQVLVTKILLRHLMI